VIRPASLRRLAIVTVVTLVTVWGSYGFRVGRMADLPPAFSSYGTFPTSGWPAVVAQWRIPAHEFVHGLLFLKAHTAAGHRSLMFGEFSQRGFLYYYPVVLAVKTPLPFILFALVGCGLLSRRRLIPSAPWFRGLAIGAVALLAAFIAAKGIVRFPEIQKDNAGGTQAEYFLVGSMASWAIALASAGLLWAVGATPEGLRIS
jgi:hypothetical protein